MMDFDATVLRQRWKPIAASIACVAIFLGFEFLLLSYGVLVLVFVNVALLAGFGAVPLFAYIFRGGLPFVSPMVGQLCMKLQFAGLGTAVIDETADGEYDVRYDDGDRDPASYWKVFNLARVGITYDRSRDGWPDETVVERDLDAMQSNSDLPGSNVEVDGVTRGGLKTYMDASAATAGDVFVKAAAVFERLRNANSMEVARRAQQQAHKEHGGDTGDHSVRTMALATFAFTFLGAGVGYVLFFL